MDVRADPVTMVDREDLEMRRVEQFQLYSERDVGDGENTEVGKARADGVEHFGGNRDSE